MLQKMMVNFITEKRRTFKLPMELEIVLLLILPQQQLKNQEECLKQK